MKDRVIISIPEKPTITFNCGGKWIMRITDGGIEFLWVKSRNWVDHGISVIDKDTEMENEEEKIQLKYKLYYGDNYYPIGGQDDFKGNFESIDCAKNHVKNITSKDYCMWAHIVLDDVILVTGKFNSMDKRQWEWSNSET